MYMHSTPMRHSLAYRIDRYYDAAPAGPSKWGLLVYDTVWLYAIALHPAPYTLYPIPIPYTLYPVPCTLYQVWLYAIAMHQLIERGESPADGAALRAELLHSSFRGITGTLAFVTSTQDRRQDAVLKNLGAPGVTKLPRVATGNLSSWLHVPIVWPGQMSAVPIDGIEVTHLYPVPCTLYPSMASR